MKYVPDYFAWDAAAQEKYRVKPPRADIFNIQSFLLKEIHGLAATSEDELDDAWSTMSHAQCTAINEAMLPLRGIGDDLFFLNEIVGDNAQLLEQPTLYNYDLHDFEFQEAARLKDFKDYEPQQYHGSLDLLWARLILDGHFTYANLSMAANHIGRLLDDYGHDYINELIPHEYGRGKNYGKAEGDGYLLDFKVDANGLEPQLEELKHRFFNYLKNTGHRLLEEWDCKGINRVFIVNESDPDDDPSHHFIFTDTTVLKSIHFKNFVRDCRLHIQKDTTEIENCETAEKQLLKEYLDAQYKEIVDNFDPKIVKLRKKYKVIAHKDAGLDKLL